MCGAVAAGGGSGRDLPVAGRLMAVAGRLMAVGQVRRVHGTAGQADIRAQMAAADLDQVVAFLAERTGHRPVAVGGDVHDGDADAEVLGVTDDLRQILVAADHHRVADRAVARQRHEVAVDLGVHPSRRPGRMRDSLSLSPGMSASASCSAVRRPSTLASYQ